MPENTVRPRRVGYHTLGCKVNQYDTEAMREKFEAAGYETVPFDGEADVYVINTCTVTGTGDHKSLQLIRRCHRQNPQADIVVCGCLAQRDAKGVALPGVRLVLGTQRRGEVVSLLEDAVQKDIQRLAVDSLKAVPFEPLTIDANTEHTRATLKIQEGCNRYCTYCIIPYVRGPIRSRPLEEIRSEAGRLADAGYRELVLTGIHLTSYGLERRDGSTLLDAIAAAQAPEGIGRVRLGSLEPVVITPEFVSGIAKMKKVCPQFHLALQSGSDAILKKMHRRYTAEEFLAACRLLRDTFPECTLTTDVMTGFPGETEENFQETMQVCETAGFARMHVFPYSERTGTPAAVMPDSVPVAEREERARRLIRLGKMLEQKAKESFVGKQVEILVEEQDAENRGTGYTEGYLRACVPDAPNGEIVSGCVEHVEGDLLICRKI